MGWNNYILKVLYISDYEYNGGYGDDYDNGATMEKLVGEKRNVSLFFFWFY